MSRNSSGAEFFAGLIIGGLVGAALAILMAPQSGEETRAQIREKSYDLKNTAGESMADTRALADAIIAEAREKAEQIVADALVRADAIQAQAKDTVSKVAQRGKASITSDKA